VAEDTALVRDFCTGLRLFQAQAEEDPQLRAALNAAIERLRGSPDLPAAVVNDFCADLGLSGQFRTVDVFAPPAPPPQGHYGCPRQVCDRRADREPGGPLPVCEVYRESMIYRP
jgi:hypothetical protein